MAGHVQRLREHIETTAQLQSVVQTIRALAEVNVRRAQTVAADVALYARSVHLALHVVLHALAREGGLWRLRTAAQEPARGRLVAVVVTSDQGLCGAFHHRITSYALALLEREAPNKADRGVITVGYRGLEKMRAAGETIIAHCHGASSVEAIPALVSQVLLALERPLGESRFGRLLVVANRPDGGKGFRESHLQLFPFDVQRWSALPEGEEPFRTIPRHDLSPRELLKFLVREQLYADLLQVIVDSFAAENDARLSAMRTAADNIEERLAELQAEYRRVRQESVTQELMDVMGGVEATKKTAREANTEEARRRLLSALGVAAPYG